MKKLLLVLFHFGAVLQAQTTYYIDDKGHDSLNEGTYSSPWKTFNKAINRNPCLASGDKIFAFNGLYKESHQLVVPEGVSIEGESMAGVVIESSFARMGEPLLLMQTANGWTGTFGNQTISFLTIDGNLITSSALHVLYRSNVHLHNLFIRDFKTKGILFRGMPHASFTVPNPWEKDCHPFYQYGPAYWCSGNKIYKCIITNNAAYGRGNINWGVQNGMEIHDCTIIQTGRSPGNNGFGIKYDTGTNGWNKNCKIYNNTITVAPLHVGQFNFAIENWYELGGLDVYGNIITGALDFVTGHKDGGSTGYSARIFNNTFGWPYLPDRQELSIHLEASVSDILIERNYFNNVSCAVSIAGTWPIGSKPDTYWHYDRSEMSDIVIQNNLMINVGMEGSGYSWGGCAGIDFMDYEDNSDYSCGSDYIENFSIFNNTITGAGCTNIHVNPYCGIVLPSGWITVNFNVKNNIIQGFSKSGGFSAAVMGWMGTSNTYLKITHNNFFNNANGDKVLFASYGGKGYYIPGPGSDYITGNIKTDPMFEGGTPYSYKPKAGSGAIRTGTFVGVIFDYAGLYWLNPPSMGAYEIIPGVH